MGADSNTIVAELAEHGNVAKYAISYDINLSGQKILDLTDPSIASKWDYVQNCTSTEACQEIGAAARTQGYNVIKFQSYRGNGVSFVVFFNFDDILVPRIVTPIDKGGEQMIEKKIRLRKELVRCDSCKQPKDFWYLSDFVYGQRLIYFDYSIEPAFINLLEDKVFLEYAELVKIVLEENEISSSAECINAFVEKTFGCACDTIQEQNIDFLRSQKKCLYCGSTKFERNMIEPESVVVKNLTIVSHEKWNKLSYVQKKCVIWQELKKEGIAG